ncbi:hypothetical protein AKG98_4083 [Moritella sp. JT01]|uniref:hypothetical protein n=1 Tax=Moritella sp. JT01 TaxID=756698 RepID=UPI0007949B93|nr:hypothetical protein [Moritella sp. JT01]KXO12887.1 hypothetical protein AKG98_4083 [Moritella sp. JT01]
MLDEILLFLKQNILIDELEIVDSIAEIDDNDQLVGSGLALDSIEILDLVASIEKKYCIKFKNYSNEIIQKKMTSILQLAQFIAEESASS